MNLWNRIEKLQGHCPALTLKSVENKEMKRKKHSLSERSEFRMLSRNAPPFSVLRVQALIFALTFYQEKAGEEKPTRWQLKPVPIRSKTFAIQRRADSVYA